MAPTSPPFIERFSNAAHRALQVPLAASVALTDYQMENLEPRPLETGLQSNSQTSNYTQRAPVLPKPSRDGYAGSLSKRRPMRAMFHGPPPPISASRLGSENRSDAFPFSYQQDQEAYGLAETLERTIGGVFPNQTGHEDTLYNTKPDTAWRGLRQWEKFLEADIQRLLDSQATSLVSVTQTSNSILRRELDGYSDAGSSTPTGTFYSTATSTSHMPRSLHLSIPTPNVGVVPVRQPAKKRPLGLRSARNGLRTAIANLVDLRLEENEHIDLAIDERMSALGQLERLDTKRLGIQSELASFNGDEEEPLGKQLREFEARHESVSEEIDILEKKLTTLRNQRRSLWNSMNDLKSKREAELSGYRGALKDVNSELHSIMRHPPLMPLDLAVLSEDAGLLRKEAALSGGAEFLRLVPGRRTSAMAKSWWEKEVEVLEKRKMQVQKERQALESGETLWSHVLSLVTVFESELRGTIQGEVISTVPSAVKGKGKETMSEAELIDSQIKRMGQVLEELEKAMGLAEENGWNLLICAIGAELEAFREAYALLKNLSIHLSMLDLPDAEQNESYRKMVGHTAKAHGSIREESDTDAPPDLLLSSTDNTDDQSVRSSNDNDDKVTNKTLSDDRPHSQGSGNEVPPEFLAEHEHGSGIYT